MPTNCVYRFISCRQNRKLIPTYVGTVPETNLLLFLPDNNRFFRQMRRWVAKKRHGFMIGGKNKPPIWSIKPCLPVSCIILLASVQCNIYAVIFWRQDDILRLDPPQRNSLSGMPKPSCDPLWPNQANIQNASGWQAKG
jgi:hypothetical protein